MRLDYHHLGRLDEILAALHEMGHENQTMQLDISKFFSRSWASDADAVNCTACGTAFSLTVRKHHCRHCGLIFCNSCSNKRYKLPSGKSPMRVCEHCSVELSAR